MEKISEEHLLEIKKSRETLEEIVSTIGELTLSKFLLKKQLEEIDSLIEEREKQFTQFQANEMVLYDTLQNAYGTGSINIETGEIVE